MLRWPPDVSVDISWFEILTSFYLTTGWRCPIKTGGIGAKTNYIHPLWWSSGYSTAWFEKSRFPANPLLEKFAAKCVNYCWSWHPANIFFMQMLLDVENRTENSNGCMAYLAGPSFRSSLRQWIWCGMIFLTEWTVGFAQTYSCQWVGCSHWCQRLRWKITALRDGYATKAWWKSYVQGAMWRWIISLQSFRRSLDIFTSLTCTRHQCKVQPVSVDWPHGARQKLEVIFPRGIHTPMMLGLSLCDDHTPYSAM